MKIKSSLLILIMISLIGIVSAQDWSGGMMGMMYGQYGWGLGILSWITSLLVIGLLIAAIYWLIKSANKKK
ncbi:MAG: hypothetical protein Q7S06_01460 [Nanoarchaeota archaeon]|nr:hypothetical protein [Nanoarchaeota archaeon]